MPHATEPPDRLQQPATAVAHQVARALLEDAVHAARRLGRREDEEALHDFRVALRRLRSWIRACGTQLADAARPKLRRRLRDVARATGGSRDLEVHLAWLRELRDAASARQRPGLEWLIARLEQRESDARKTLDRELARDFRRTARRLGDHLDRADDASSASAEPTWGEVAASLVRERVDTLRQALGRVRTVHDVEEAHRVRIAGKRLRYLLEQLFDVRPELDEAVRALRALQDDLGDLHDAHLMEDEIVAAAADAAAEHATAEARAVLNGVPAERGSADGDPRAGLLAVARWLRARERRAFAAVRGAWLDGLGEPFLGRVAAIGEGLATQDAATEPTTTSRLGRNA